MVYEFSMSCTLSELGLCNIVELAKGACLPQACQRAPVSHADTPPRYIRPSKAQPAGWAPDGFAAIPITAIDPPQRAASPAVPALLGPGALNTYAASLGSVDVISAIF